MQTQSQRRTGVFNHSANNLQGFVTLKLILFSSIKPRERRTKRSAWDTTWNFARRVQCMQFVTTKS